MRMASGSFDVKLRDTKQEWTRALILFAKERWRGDEEEIDFSNRARVASHDSSPRLLYYGAEASGE